MTIQRGFGEKVEVAGVASGFGKSLADAHDSAVQSASYQLFNEIGYDFQDYDIEINITQTIIRAGCVKYSSEIKPEYVVAVTWLAKVTF